MLNLNKKTKKFENFIMNISCFFNIEKKNFIYFNYFIFENKNFNFLTDRIKHEPNSYFFDIQESLNFNKLSSLDKFGILEDNNRSNKVRNKSSDPQKEKIFDNKKSKIFYFKLFLDKNSEKNENSNFLFLNFLTKFSKTFEDYIIYGINYTFNYFEILIFSNKFKFIKSIFYNIFIYLKIHRI